jgi:hypothetical protein
MNPKPLGALVNVATPVQSKVEVQSSKVLIHELAVERPDILDYIRTISPDKQGIALVHAIEVGVMEIMARKRRLPRAS